MNARISTVWAIAILLCVGVTSVAFRLKFKPVQGESVWKLTYSASFHARKAGAELRAAFPETTTHCHVAESPTIPPDMQLVPRRVVGAVKNRDLVLRAKKVGQIDCKIEFKIHLSRSSDYSADFVDTPLAIHDRNRYLGKGKGIVVDHPVVLETVNRYRDGQPTQQELVARLFEHCLRNIVPAGDAAASDNIEALVHGTASPLGRARAFVSLCRACKIPARLVTGFEIKQSDNFHPRTWVEVHFDHRWQPYDPENGFAQELDYNFVPVMRGGTELIHASNPTDASDAIAADLTAKYAIEKVQATPGAVEPNARNMWDILDLHGLPAKLHEPIKIILILPIGALFTAFVRTIIGIRTFGTFSPTLLALAFVYNDWRSGLVVFIAVLIMGFTSRTVLDRLKLLLVPRLGIILTLVVMLMVLGVAIMNYFRWTHKVEGETVLLPMVILTNLVERFFVTTEENNIREAIRLMLTTMVMAAAIYLLLNFKYLGTLLFDFPELHFFTVIVLIVMGRYTGYRVMELIRFRDLAKPIQPQE